MEGIRFCLIKVHEIQLVIHLNLLKSTCHLIVDLNLGSQLVQHISWIFIKYFDRIEGVEYASKMHAKECHIFMV